VVCAVSQGATNREAFAQLLISPPIVDHHLRRVFLKLAIRSRPKLSTSSRPATPALPRTVDGPRGVLDRDPHGTGRMAETAGRSAGRTGLRCSRDRSFRNPVSVVSY
jgi:hypothetical protein